MILHCKAKLGRGQPGRMRWMSLWIMPWRRIDRSTCWQVVQRATTVQRKPPNYLSKREREREREREIMMILDHNWPRLRTRIIQNKLNYNEMKWITGMNKKNRHKIPVNESTQTNLLSVHNIQSFRQQEKAVKKSRGIELHPFDYGGRIFIDNGAKWKFF